MNRKELKEIGEEILDNLNKAIKPIVKELVKVYAKPKQTEY